MNRKIKSQSREELKLAKTVNQAFEEFMRDFVNLDPDVSNAAKVSRQNLLDNIDEFDNDDDFFDLHKDFNINFGSFARKTKCRELDDIDLMVGIAANGATYNSSDPWDNIRIYASQTNKGQKQCAREDGTLNSTKVSNKFQKKLELVREYSRSEIRRNGEAIRLNLKSKEWAFDIVPCFYTTPETDDRPYYLIPNGRGNWKKTAPDVDRKYVTKINQDKDGRVLELVRLCKKWNKVNNANPLPSYLLETMIVNFANHQESLDKNLGIRFRDALKYVVDFIRYSVFDMKNIQGNINTLEWSIKCNIRRQALTDYNKVLKALQYEQSGNHEKAIKVWSSIFESDFPTYG